MNTLDFNSTIGLINKIDLPSLKKYLKDHKWKKEQEIEGRASIWITQQNNKRYSIFLPEETESPDFEDRMFEALKTLEYVEKKQILEIISNFENVSVLAKREQREVFNIKFKFIEDNNIQEASVKKIGSFLSHLQELFYAVGNSVLNKENNRGKFSNDVTDRTELYLFETFKGSFGVKLALANPPIQFNFFENPLEERVSEHFIELIKRSNLADKETLKQYLIFLKKRASANYRKFLMTIINSRADMYVNWGSVNPEKGGQAELTFSNAIQTVEFINKMEQEEPEEITVLGELIAADKSKKTFILVDNETKKRFYGKILESIVLNRNIELTIGKYYQAVIQEVSSINPATGEEKTEHTIISIININKVL